MNEGAHETIHATTVAIDGRAILLIGPSGSGKSDLALRLIDRGAALVSDDYTDISLTGGQLIASPPKTIAGKIEVRGIGIIERAHIASAPVVLILDLGAPLERMPDTLQSRVIAGIAIPILPFAPFETSAHIKVALALGAFGLATDDHGTASAS